ncbi:MAG: V-type ATP synthase subunit E family protein [Armatimonadota bacterium]|nr:V-type ATP synthase subunit E family protein [Armatimonadota bacterium]MDR7485508.1 V-type ATP synthase subunit E family protein [Armatimonadota bacterium]MDR7533053.1 V-type ATP synthase subunit E family protein [Armatimonadota bacterium]MDR7536775.1 V-type ATP synthase subunit E family protein [Armatimonadota bacterium]
MTDRALAEAIMRRAEAERAQILAEAAAEAAALRARAQADAEAVRAAAAAAGRTRGRREAARLLSRARMDLLAEETRLLDAAVQRVFAGAADALAAARQRPDYPAVFRRLLDEALAQAPRDGPIVVHVDPQDAALAAAGELPQAARVVPDLRSAGGAIVEAWAGMCVVDNTLETRLQAQARRLRPMVGRLLEAGWSATTT